MRALPGDEVVGVRGAIRYAFNKPLRDWRDRHVVDMEAEDILALTFGPGARVTRSGDAWTGDASLAPFDWVDPSARTIARLRAVDFAPEGTTPAAAGLEPPQRAIRVESQAAELNLEVGGNAGEGNIYLRRSGDDTIYVVTSYVAARLQPSPAGSSQAQPRQAQPRQPQAGQTLPPEIMEAVQQQLEQERRRQRRGNE